MSPFIGFILGARGLTKVAIAVVQRVPITMISSRSAACQNLAVHVDGPAISLADGIEAFGAGIPPRIPVPLHEPVIFISTDERDLALCKWDYFVRWVERLNNRRTVDVAFGHSLSLQEIAAFSRFSIVA